MDNFLEVQNAQEKNDKVAQVNEAAKAYLKMSALIEKETDCLKVKNSKDSIKFETPLAWWEDNRNALIADAAPEADVRATTWQSEMLEFVLEELYGLDMEQDVTIRKHENAISGRKVMHHCISRKSLKDLRVRAVWKTTAVVQLKKNLQLALAGQKSTFKQKEDRLNEYQAGQMLLLLRGKVKPVIDESKDKDATVFIRPSAWQEKNHTNTKSDYEVVATGYGFQDEDGYNMVHTPMEPLTVELRDKDGKQVTYRKKAAGMVNLDEDASWDKINEAAIEQGIAHCVYPTVGDWLGHGIVNTPSPFDLITSLSRTELDHHSRVVNWKVLLGGKNGRYFEGDSNGLDMDVLDELRENLDLIGLNTTKKGTATFIEMSGPMPNVPYRGNESTWMKDMTAINYQNGRESTRVDGWKKWVDITPHPAVQYNKSGVELSFDFADGNSLFSQYPLFFLVETKNK